MTEIEAVEFVKVEIAGRYKQISDAVRGDWIRAVKNTSRDMAQRIIRELAEDPDETLTVKGFYRKLKTGNVGGPRVELIAYVPWVRCIEAPLEHPEWVDQEWLRLDTMRQADCGNKENVAQYAREAAEGIAATYGGAWTGVLRLAGQVPEGHPVLWGQDAQQWTEEHILSGPDSPGRQVLLWIRAKGQAMSLTEAIVDALPVVENPLIPVIASREMLDALESGVRPSREPGEDEEEDE